MFSLLKKSILMTVVLVVLTCGIYPAAVWVFGKILFSEKASGSLVYKNGQVVGSKLIAQNFEKSGYFHPRPSAAGDKGYDATNSSGSNLSLTNKKFVDGVTANIKKELAQNPTLKAGEIPPDMVMASGSGLDPHISPENAFKQVARVALARHISEEVVATLVKSHVRSPDLGFLGVSYVNVLELNLALDESFGK